MSPAVNANILHKNAKIAYKNYKILKILKSKSQKNDKKLRKEIFLYLNILMLKKRNNKFLNNKMINLIKKLKI